MKWLLTLAIFSVMGFASIRAQEKPGEAKAAPAKDDVKARIETYLSNGKSGVFYSETHDTKDGQILRVFIVGSSTISTVLGAEKGLEIAEDRAEAAAKTAFLSWMKGKGSMRKSASNEVILTTEGEQGDGVESKVKDLGKEISKTSKEFEESASGMLRGLKVVASESRSKEKKYVVVYRLDTRNLAAIEKLDNKLNNPTTNKEPAPTVKEKPVDPTKPAPKNTIPDKKIIIDD